MSSRDRPRFKSELYPEGPEDASDLGFIPDAPLPEDVGEAPSGVGVATPIEEGGIGRDPALSEPSEPAKTTWEGRDAQLDRRQRQKVVSSTRPKIEEESLSVTPVIEESVDSGMVTHLGVTMTREQFEADFPEDTIPYSPLPSHSGSSPMGEWLQNVEDSAVGFKTNMEMAGREMGAEALEAWEEGDYTEALFKGFTAATTRFGTGIYDAASFMFRPLAWVKTGEALYSGTKDVIEHPEDVPSGVQKWVENIKHDPGSIVQFAGDIATGLAVGEVIKTLAGPSHTLTRLDDVDIDVKSTTLKMVDEVDPITGKSVKVPQFPEADITSTVSKRKIPKTVSEIMDTELDDIAGTGQILGVADEGGITVLDKIDLPKGTIDDLLEGTPVKVDDVIDVETLKIGSETFEYVDEIADPFTGTKTKTSRTGKATPLDAKEIGVTMEVAEDASRLSKLTLETGDSILDEKIITRPPPEIDFDTVKFKSLWNEEGVTGILDEGKRSYDVKGMIVESTETLDDLIDDITHLEPTGGPKTPLSKHFQQPGYTAPLKDISASLVDDISIVRELTDGVKPVAKIITEEAKGSPIIPAGIGLGSSLESDPFIEEVTTPTKVKPWKRTGPPTQFGDMGTMPGLLEGPPKPDGGRGRLPSPYFKGPLELEKDRAKSRKDEGKTGTKGKSTLEDMKITTKTWEDELGLFDEKIPVLDIDVKDDLGLIDDVKPVIDTDIDLLPKPTPFIIVKPKPKPEPKPKPLPKPPKIDTKTIPDIIPIFDIIGEPIQDTTVKQVQKIRQKQEQKLFAPSPLSMKSLFHKPMKPRPRRKQKKKKRKGDPLIGFELRSYKYRTPEELLGSGKAKNLFGRKKGKKEKLF